MLGSQVVYFVQRDSDGAIKIGVTGDLQSRVASVGRSAKSTVRLLGSMPGDGLWESLVHRMFAAHRIVGEWFRPHPDLLAFAATPDRARVPYVLDDYRRREVLMWMRYRLVWRWNDRFPVAREAA